MKCGSNCSVLTTLSSYTSTLLSMPITLLTDILLSKDKVRGLYIKLKEDTLQDKEVEEKLLCNLLKLITHCGEEY